VCGSGAIQMVSTYPQVGLVQSTVLWISASHPEVVTHPCPSEEGTIPCWFLGKFGKQLSMLAIPASRQLQLVPEAGNTADQKNMIHPRVIFRCMNHSDIFRKKIETPKIAAGGTTFARLEREPATIFRKDKERGRFSRSILIQGF